MSEQYDVHWFPLISMILAALSKRPGADSHDLPQAAWRQSSISWARHVPRQDTLPGRTIGRLGSLGLGNTPKQWQQQFITIHHHLSLSSFITSSRCFSLVCAICDFLICGFGVSTAVVLGTYWAEIGVQTDLNQPWRSRMGFDWAYIFHSLWSLISYGGYHFSLST